MVKDADLVLLDEPLANLDFKLREELRDELPKLLGDRHATVVYATTEPSEALLLGGHTAALDKGRVTQFGETGRVYRDPDNLNAAATFSEPPINQISVTKRGNTVSAPGGEAWPLPSGLAPAPDGHYTLALRPHHVTVERRHPGDVELGGQVLVTEISGSERHPLRDARATWVSQSHGIHRLAVDSVGRFFADLGEAMLFDAQGARLRGEA